MLRHEGERAPTRLGLASPTGHRFHPYFSSHLRHELGGPEVGQERAVAARRFVGRVRRGEEDVVRLQVAVQDSGRVEVLQAGAHIEEELDLGSK